MWFINCDEYTIVVCYQQGTQELSALSSQLFCKSKTTVTLKVVKNR